MQDNPFPDHFFSQGAGKIMRKLFWCCAVAAVAMAAAVYVAADYAAHHPGSWAERCLAAGYEVGGKYHPVQRLGEFASHYFGSSKAGCVAKAAGCKPTAAEAQDGCVPSCEKACEPGGFMKDVVIPTEWDSDPVLPHTLGKIVIRPEDHPELASNRIPKLIDMIGGEESETVPPSMPHVGDKVPAPATMPHVGADGPDCFDHSGIHYRDVILELPNAGTAEDSEATAEPGCPEDMYHRFHRYPGCPQSPSCCPFSGKCATPYPSEKPQTESKPMSTVEEPQEDGSANKDGKPAEKKNGLDTMEFRRSDGVLPAAIDRIPY
jgi:hypothetical protein